MDNKSFRRGSGFRVVAALFGVWSTVASAFCLHAAAADAKPTEKPDRAMSLDFGGHERTFFIHVPKDYDAADAAKKPLPLLLMLHGAGGDGLQAARQTGWDDHADKEKFIVAYPDALPANPEKPVSFRLNPRYWDDGSKRGQQVRGPIDDVGFLGAVIDNVEKRYPIDPTRVYLTGFSSGASMTFHAVASPLSARIAAAAIVSGHLFGADKAQIVRVAPVLLIYGTRDPLNPMEGGVAPMPWGGTSERPKVSDTVATWAKLTGCPAEPVPISDENGVKRVAYGPGKNGVEFLFWTIDGMGHHWPGSKAETLPESLVGSPSDKLDATDAIWTFLARHTLSERAEKP